MMHRLMNLSWKIKLSILLLVVFLAIQIIPTSAGDNPPVTNNFTWDSTRTEELARTACFDCHSNETNWTWYSYIAPVSWLVTRDVDEGREALNFSTGHNVETDELIESIREGEMPPAIYLIMHPEANLNESEQDELISGMIATLGMSGEDEGNVGEDEDHEQENEQEDNDD